MIIDAFCFFNELDLLEIRLHELSPHVDYFVLVEANRTQSLNSKPFYYEENKERFALWSSKIIHVKVTDGPNNVSNLWEMEHYQRNCISRGLDRIHPDGSDSIMISDLDEIPDMQAVIPALNFGHRTFSVDMGFYAYYLNLKARNRSWIGTTICPYSQLPSAQAMRNMKDHLPLVVGGWHFSWLGGYQKIWLKSQSCIEPLDKSTIPTEEEFKSYFQDFLLSDKKFFLHLENLNRRETAFGAVAHDVAFPAITHDPKFSHLILK